jgi:glycosyltransferase involved in cell wall biosynthesis
MAEMLNFGTAGRLVPPCDHAKLARAIIELLAAPGLRSRLGTLARERVLEQYKVDRICPMQEQSYRRAIQRRTAAGTRAL